MKRTVIISILVTFLLMVTNSILVAQRTTTVNQIIVVNGGNFNNPADYVTVETYNPTTQTVTVFDTIYTQSVQDVVIFDHFAFVAAQDSIIKYDIDTYQRVAEVADSGISRIYYTNNKLIVSKQFPVVRFYVEVLDATSLSTIAMVEGISGDCRGIEMYPDSIYVAVNGGYSGLEGKMAIINASTWSLVRELNFGPQAIGIDDLFNYNGHIYSVNQTPYGAGDTGSVTKYNVFNGTYDNHMLGVNMGSGIGISGSYLYAGMNYGIGSYNLNTDTIAIAGIIPDPGSANHIYLLATALDYLNNLFYMNIGNYNTFGIGIVATINGDSVTSFQEGLSANALAIDFRTPTGIKPAKIKGEVLSIFPNPVTDMLNIVVTGKEVARRIRISDVTGNIIYDNNIGENQQTARIDCSTFASGVYFLTLITDNGFTTKKFTKK
ncbi:MAG: T9SS type A sorting domain-containing protein [Bacteroidetes bacterium]|nr:T9SS type A sorting domain-containing protein [Bacteroidota bacterium]